MPNSIGYLAPLQGRSLNDTAPQDLKFNLGELSADKSEEVRRGKAPLPRPAGGPPAIVRDGEQPIPRMTLPAGPGGKLIVESAPKLKEARFEGELGKPFGGKVEVFGGIRELPASGVTNYDTGIRLTAPRIGGPGANVNLNATITQTTNEKGTTEATLTQVRANVGNAFVGATLRGTPEKPTSDVEVSVGAKIPGGTLSINSRERGGKEVESSLRFENRDFRGEIVKQGDDYSVRANIRFDF